MKSEQLMNGPKMDCEALMNSALPFAEQMLTAHGEFFPFGAAMRPNGQIDSIAAYDGCEHPRSADLITLMKEGFVAAASKGEYKATAIIYDSFFKPSSTDEKFDAIAVSLNHQDNYSVVVFFPYKIEEGKLVLGEALAQKGEGDIFPTATGFAGLLACLTTIVRVLKKQKPRSLS